MGKKEKQIIAHGYPMLDKTGNNSEKRGIFNYITATWCFRVWICDDTVSITPHNWERRHCFTHYPSGYYQFTSIIPLLQETRASQKSFRMMASVFPYFLELQERPISPQFNRLSWQINGQCEKRTKWENIRTFYGAMICYILLF